MLRTRNGVVSAAACGGLLVLSSLATVGQTPAQDGKPSPEDQARVEAQLRNLEAQRAKLDAQIRDLRRQEGREGRGSLRVFTGPGPVLALPGGSDTRTYTYNNGLRNLTPEQRKEVEQALDEARRALDKVRKDLPPGTLLPAIPNFDDGFFYNFAPGARAGRAFTFTNPMTEEQKAQLKAQMDKLKAEMKANSADIRKQVEDARRQARQWRSLAPGAPAIPAAPNAPYLTIPAVPAAPGATVRPRIVVPAAPGRGDAAELRDEVRQLREEVERLRDEMRRQRPGRSGGSSDTTRPDRFVQPFGGQ